MRGETRGHRPRSPLIDAVVTWVDGAELDWASAFGRWDRRIPDTVGADGRDAARYRDHGELRFVLRSIWRFAPWIRRIHLVTSGQTPTWLGPHPSVVNVSHQEILEGSALPTFNSHAIEARLHHIPGVAEYFVYLNDDVFFGRPQRREHYVTDDGDVCVPLSDLPLPNRVTSTGAAVDVGALNALALLHGQVATAPSRRPAHGPITNRTAHLLELEARFGDALAATQHNRFRSASDVPLPTFLAPVDALGSGQAVPATLRFGYVGLDDEDLEQQLASFAADPGVDAFCLNDTERVPAEAPALRRRIVDYLAGRFPDPAPWELDVPTTAAGLGGPRVREGPTESTTMGPTGAIPVTHD